MLNPEELKVESFATSDSGAAMRIAPGGGYCCTGCDSGCGINPTAGGCESGSGQVICMETAAAY